MLLKGEWREFIMNLIMSDYVSRRTVGKEGISYHIRLIVNLKSNQWKSLHLGIAQ